MDSINPNFKRRPQRPLSNADDLLKGILAGNRSKLGQALTLCESKLATHRKEAEKLLQMALPHSGNSVRIGITGVPGVGKSTFIEAFGEYLISQGNKVAVLAIDPSSAKTGGSILGDKTRMELLTQNENAFIRPSPSGGSLGGVARRTRESILLCEAAGYNVILVETVGVGQSETTVKNMVDFFMLLMLASAGDELQGIKRGIMEMADLVLINKADSPDDPQVKMAMGDYKRALHLFPANDNEWIPPVQACSALNKTGLEAAWSSIEQFQNQQKLKGYWAQNRSKQALSWFEDSIGEIILEQVRASDKFNTFYQAKKEAVAQGEIEPGLAAHALANEILKHSF